MNDDEFEFDMTGYKALFIALLKLSFSDIKDSRKDSSLDLYWLSHSEFAVEICEFLNIDHARVVEKAESIAFQGVTND